MASLFHQHALIARFFLLFDAGGPSNDWCRYLAICERDVNLAYHGSLRAYLDENAASPAGGTPVRIGAAAGADLPASSDGGDGGDNDVAKGGGGDIGNSGSGSDGGGGDTGTGTGTGTGTAPTGGGGGAGGAGAVVPSRNPFAPSSKANVKASPSSPPTASTSERQHFRPSIRWEFGLAYFDYCSSLYSGFDSIEKSPVEDIKALFRGGTLSKEGGAVSPISSFLAARSCRLIMVCFPRG
jgi:hypothetical protein